MNKIQAYINILLLFILLGACTEEIEMDFKTDRPQLVVDGYFTNQHQDHFVQLSVTSAFQSDQESPSVSGAVLSLTDGQNNIVLNELTELPGSYVIPSSYVGIPGNTYTLSISNVDVNGDGITETYEASNVMNPIVPIDSISLDWTTTQGQKQWQILLFTQEPEDTKEYYAFIAYLNNALITPKLSDIEYADDKFFNGNEVNGVWVQSVVEEDSDGDMTDYILQKGDWVKLEMQSINKDYYDFLLAVDEETGLQIPLFSGPPANVPTNVSNDGRGFFRVYSLTQDSIQVTEDILKRKE
ncbi:DUF4249 family protein [Saccharicrinis fermentans]|uniref:DUF4249 domain-containing protein n=1 Tax=Saccharicrinis fermentans DSM 9555 = JCM 21142 TaxID=869213 RepID=W7Y8I4_9BACT|nr:DUF4249 family protein [Saccharicrinis fermentans]GAF03998.1 hypothetical protein JCM21142_72690 [Saccharicrinis fermentans DSM 9555 = JCM 21142]